MAPPAAAVSLAARAAGSARAPRISAAAPILGTGVVHLRLQLRLLARRRRRHGSPSAVGSAREWAPINYRRRCLTRLRQGLILGLARCGGERWMLQKRRLLIGLVFLVAAAAIFGWAAGPASASPPGSTPIL